MTPIVRLGNLSVNKPCNASLLTKGISVFHFFILKKIQPGIKFENNIFGRVCQFSEIN